MLKFIRKSILGRTFVKLKHRRQALSLLDADPRMLRDIGLMPDDVLIATRRDLTTDATTRLRVMAVERRAIQVADARLHKAYTERLVPDFLQKNKNARV